MSVCALGHWGLPAFWPPGTSLDSAWLGDPSHIPHLAFEAERHLPWLALAGWFLLALLSATSIALQIPPLPRRPAYLLSQAFTAKHR